MGTKVLYFSFNGSNLSQYEKICRQLVNHEIFLIDFESEHRKKSRMAKFPARRYFPLTKGLRFVNLLVQRAIYSLSTILLFGVFLIYFLVRDYLPPSLRRHLSKDRFLHLITRYISSQSEPSDQNRVKTRFLVKLLSKWFKNTYFLRRLIETLELFHDTESSIDLDSFSLAIIPEENILNFVPLLILRLKSAGLKIVCFQYTVGMEDEWLAAFAGDSRSLFGRMDRILSKTFFPEYVNRTRYGAVSILPFSVCLIGSLLKIESSSIWSGYLGFSNRLLIDSESELLRLQSVYGYVGQVDLVSPLEISENATVQGQLGNSARRSPDFPPKIVIFLPPDQGASRRSILNFGSDIDFNGFLASILNQLGQFFPSDSKFVVFNHPRDNFELEELSFSGHQEIRKGTEMIDEVSDCSAAVIFTSALFRILVDLKVPVINWDVYNYAYPNTFPKNSNFFLNIDRIEEAKSWLEVGYLTNPEIYKVDSLLNRKNLEYVISELTVSDN